MEIKYDAHMHTYSIKIPAYVINKPKIEFSGEHSEVNAFYTSFKSFWLLSLKQNLIDLNPR